MSMIMLVEDKITIQMHEQNKDLTKVYMVFGTLNDFISLRDLDKKMAYAISRVIQHFNLEYIVDGQFTAQYIDQKYKTTDHIKIEMITDSPDSYNDLIKRALAGDFDNVSNSVHLRIGNN